MRGQALLFGLNYRHCSSGHLSGCINDVENIGGYLKSTFGIPIRILTDRDNRRQTSKRGILRSLSRLARESHRKRLSFVWIHYSGHGTNIRDRNKDERDGQDECMVPSDCERGKLISDDEINKVLKRFWQGTKVICFFDCCHSGTLADLRFTWSSEASFLRTKQTRTKKKIIAFSGCLDSQTSADAFAVSNINQYSGAMSSCLLLVLQEEDTSDVFHYLKET